MDDARRSFLGAQKRCYVVMLICVTQPLSPMYCRRECMSDPPLTHSAHSVSFIQAPDKETRAVHMRSSGASIILMVALLSCKVWHSRTKT